MVKCYMHPPAHTQMEYYEDHQSDQSDASTVFDNDDDSNSENAWSDDSESEADI